MDQVKIILVEDDDIDVRAVKRAFKEEKIKNNIVVAPDGVEALKIMREGNVQKPWLVLLDLNMPRMSGLEFLKEIRKDPALKDSIVFVVTTSASPQDLTEAYKYNIAGYLLKSEIGKEFMKSIKMLSLFLVSVQFPPPREIGSPEG